MVNKYTVIINLSMPKVTNNFELNKTFLNLFRLSKMGKKDKKRSAFRLKGFTFLTVTVAMEIYPFGIFNP